MGEPMADPLGDASTASAALSTPPTSTPQPEDEDPVELWKLQVSLPSGKAAEIAATRDTTVRELMEEAGLQLGVDVKTLVLQRGPRILEEGETVDSLGLHSEDTIQVIVLSPVDTDLTSFHGYARIEDITDQGAFANVRKIAIGLYGDVRLLEWTKPNGEKHKVVAKKSKSSDVWYRGGAGCFNNEIDAHFAPPQHQSQPRLQDELTEIGVLSYLKEQADLPLFLTKMLGCFMDGESVVVLSELVEDGELFHHVVSGRLSSDEASVREHMWQLLQAVRYLHEHDIGHRGISMEEILISFDATGAAHVRLIDLAQAVRTRSRSGKTRLRYFRRVGRPYYSGPECYVSATPEVAVCAPADARGGDVVFVDNLTDQKPNGLRNEVLLPIDAVAGKPCVATAWGYEVPPLDVFSLGVCFFILAWHVPPWSRALPSDPAFKYVQLHGLSALIRGWQKEDLSPEAMRLLSFMVAGNPQHRWSAQECLASDWFDPLAATPVPLHA